MDDELLRKIEVCQSKTRQFIAFLERYEKPDDVKEFLEGLRAVEKQLQQAHRMKKLLKGYNLLDAEPLDHIYNHLVELSDRFENLSKSNALFRSLRSISLRKKLEKSNTDLQKEVNRLLKRMNENVELEKKRREKMAQLKKNNQQKQTHANKKTNKEDEEVETKGQWTQKPEKTEREQRSPLFGGARSHNSNNNNNTNGPTPTSPKSQEKDNLRFSITNERKQWLSQTEELIQLAMQSGDIDTPTHYGSVIVDERKAEREQSLIPPDNHYTAIDGGSPRRGETNGNNASSSSTSSSPRAVPPPVPQRKPQPSTPPSTPVESEIQYTRLGPQVVPKPVTPRKDLARSKSEESEDQPYAPMLSTKKKPKPPMPSNYDPFQVESSAYDPMMDDEDDSFDEEDEDDTFGTYETIVCSEKEQEGAPWTLIDDPDGVALWKEFDGGSQFSVDWDEFEKVFTRHIGRETLTDTERKVLQHIIDNYGNGVVSAYKFSEMLKGFGPLKQCLQNIVKVVTQPWFHGFLTRDETARLLSGEEVGTYLVRFSITRPGSFALALVARNRTITHTLIESNLPYSRMKLEEVKKSEHKKQIKQFDSLFDVLKYYHAKGLKKPFTCSYIRQSWFHGELSSDEAVQVLSGMEVGTYLIRFSSEANCFASSYVSKSKKVTHSRIEKTIKGFKDTQTGAVWPTLEEMVAKCHNTLRIPLLNSRADIYVFQRVLLDSGEMPAEDNYKGLEDEDNDYKNNNNKEDDNDDNGYEVEPEDQDNGNHNGAAKGEPKTQYTMLPSEMDWGEKEKEEKEKEKDKEEDWERTGEPQTVVLEPRKGGQPRPQRSPAAPKNGHTKKTAIDNYGVMDY